MSKRSPEIERRLGPSRLSMWSGRRIAALWLLWPGSVIVICVLAVAVSVHVYAGFGEVRTDLTRRNLIGLTLVIVAPPAYLTGLWWRMRRRRHAGQRR